jgi:cation diffusion facilitator CzcD-associated flavoprotein CzcO
MHTARWKSDVDLSGKRVAVIGSGSSGAQVIPQLQPVVEKLYTWIRSPIWITPGFASKYAGVDGGNFECKSGS